MDQTDMRPKGLSDFPPRQLLLKQRVMHSRLYVALLVLLVFSFGTRIPTESLTYNLMVWCGLVLVVIGVFIRIFCTLFIGGRKNSELVTDGPFSVVRNPLYLGSWIAILGIGLQSASILILLMLILGFVLYYPFVVRREESFLLLKFGDDYARYAAVTPRFIPNFGLWHSPEEINCQPYRIFRTMLDGLVFFLPLPIADMVHLLQSQGILPIFGLIP